jgi:hypothetical protein
LQQRLCCRETLEQNGVDTRCGRNRKSITAAKIRKDIFYTSNDPRHARARRGHPRLVVCVEPKTWMAGTTPAMTVG